MNEVMITRTWYDDDNQVAYEIRFFKIDEEWWAVLQDVCNALNLKTFDVSRRINTQFLLKRTLPVSDMVSTHNRYRGECINRKMTLVNELGIYQCINGSRKMEARKFSDWWLTIIRDLRRAVRLESFQVMDMLDERVQQHITTQLERFLPEFDPYEDNIFYDEEKGMLMKTVTLPGGDVDVVPYDGEEYKLVED